MAEQHAPIETEPANQMRPIEFHRAAAKNMRNVGAIEALALHYVRLHPNHFLGCAKFHPQSQQLVIVRTLEP